MGEASPFNEKKGNKKKKASKEAGPGATDGTGVLAEAEGASAGKEEGKLSKVSAGPLLAKTGSHASAASQHAKERAVAGDAQAHQAEAKEPSGLAELRAALGDLGEECADALAALDAHEKPGGLQGLLNF